jgi:hypothetical protein
VTDVVDTLKLGVQRIFVVKIFAQPVKGMTGRSFEVAFT